MSPSSTTHDRGPVCFTMTLGNQWGPVPKSTAFVLLAPLPLPALRHSPSSRTRPKPVSCTGTANHSRRC
ncbi:hypothetical protein FKM82_029168 [Ascaphus truei]